MSKSTYELMSALTDVLGDDVFALSLDGEVKHALVETVLASIIAALLSAFLTALIDPKNFGGSLRLQVRALIDAARNNKNPPDRELLIVKIVGQLTDVEGSSTQSIDKARAALHKVLVDEGVSERSADRICSAVSKAVGNATGSSP